MKVTIRIALLALFLLLSVDAATAADRYWVGGTGTWNTSTTNWSATSGGAGGASTPGSSDTAIFDTSSGGGTVTINQTGGRSVASLDMGAAAAMTLAGTGANSRLAVSTAVILGTSVAYTIAGTLALSSAVAFTSNGNSWSGTFSLADVMTLQDDFVYAGDLSGPVNANNHTITVKSYTNTSGINGAIGSGTWTITGTGTCWYVASDGMDAGTGTIKFTNTSNSSVTFEDDNVGGSYPNIWFSRGSSTGTNAIYYPDGFIQFTDVKDDGAIAHTLTLTAGVLLFLNTFSVSGHSGNLISLRSSSSGTQASLRASSGTISSDYLNIKDSSALGGAIWNAGSHSINNGNVSGWNFLVGSTVPFSMLPL